jgi:NADH-quinone oxidoreductase subunit J
MSDVNITFGPGTATGPLILFCLFGALSIIGAIATITRRNAVVAVACLVGTFFCLAVEFLLLYASFLAVMQVMVYAGAIMVLFVFVVMVVNRDDAEWTWDAQTAITNGLRVAAVALLLLVTYRAIASYGGASTSPPPDGFGSVNSVGRILVGEYVFPFEAISILLLVAVVGSLVIARHHHDKDRNEAP